LWEIVGDCGRLWEIVGDRLVELGLLPVLRKMVERLDWSPPPNTAEHSAHGAGCSCSPQSCLQLQLLRMLQARPDTNTRTASQTLPHCPTVSRNLPPSPALSLTLPTLCPHSPSL